MSGQYVQEPSGTTEAWSLSHYGRVRICVTKDLCDSGLICFLSFPLAPFLCHPNLWIRYGAVGFITVVAHQISTADVYCKLMPYLDPYITQPVIQVRVFQLMPGPFPVYCWSPVYQKSLNVKIHLNWSVTFLYTFQASNVLS